ncbi:MAG: hypothetical protein RIQ70_1407 [Bacteroidota bacterium]|jgi:autotransporter-associated beta strand protein
MILIFKKLTRHVFPFLWIILTCFVTHLTHATTYTWDGSSSNLWNTAANWDLNAVPSTGDDLIFPSGVATVSTSNDIAANTVFKSITFGAGGASAYTLSGNALTLSGGATAITASNASNTMIISLNITFSTAAPTITTTSGGTLTISGTIANGGLLLTVSSAGTTNLNGIVSGSGAITTSGIGTLKLGAANTFTGGVNLNAGTLQLGNGTCLGTVAGTFTIAAGTSIYSSSSLTMTANNPIVINGSFTYSGIATTAMGTGAVTLNANTTITLSTNSFKLQGPISGAFNIIQAGIGTLTLSSTASDFTGTFSSQPSTAAYTAITNLANVGGGASSLGAPTTAANGTLSLGINNISSKLSFANTAAFSTDRIIDMVGNAGTQSGVTLEANAANSAHTVIFTSDIAISGATTHFFTLQGTNTGDNTIVGIIKDYGGSNITRVVKSQTGKWCLTGLNTYTDKTYIQTGTLSVNTIKDVGIACSLGAPINSTTGAIGIGNSTNSATLIYTGTAQTTDRVIEIRGTTGGVIIDQSGTGLLKFTSALICTNTGTKTLTLQGSTAGTGELGGAIVDGSGIVDVTKDGTNTWTLSGANSYTGVTTISAGTLTLGLAHAIPSSQITLNGGTFSSGSGAGFSNTTTGKLGLTESSTIALGTGSHALRLAASTGSFTANKTLTITGWLGGYNGTSGTSGQVFTGATTELSAGELTQIRFYRSSNASYYTATQLGTGEIVPTAVLPVVFIRFDVVKNTNENVLAWSTSQETDNKLFEIERAHDGMNFEIIGSIQGNRTTSSVSKYIFSDKSVNSFLPTYYRLKQIDLNNQFEYSSVVFLNGAETNKTLSIFPNPIKEGENIFIQFNDNDAGTANVDILNLSGVLLHEFDINPIDPAVKNEIDLQPLKLKKGEYLFKIKTVVNEYHAKIMVK